MLPKDVKKRIDDYESSKRIQCCTDGVATVLDTQHTVNQTYFNQVPLSVNLQITKVNKAVLSKDAKKRTDDYESPIKLEYWIDGFERN